MTDALDHQLQLEYERVQKWRVHMEMKREAQMNLTKQTQSIFSKQEEEMKAKQEHKDKVRQVLRQDHALVEDIQEETQAEEAKRQILTGALDDMMADQKILESWQTTHQTWQDEAGCALTEAATALKALHEEMNLARHSAVERDQELRSEIDDIKAEVMRKSEQTEVDQKKLDVIKGDAITLQTSTQALEREHSQISRDVANLQEEIEVKEGEMAEFVEAHKNKKSINVNKAS